MLTVTHIASARELLYDVNSSFFQECTKADLCNSNYNRKYFAISISGFMTRNSQRLQKSFCLNISQLASLWHLRQVTNSQVI